MTEGLDCGRMAEMAENLLRGQTLPIVFFFLVWRGPKKWYIFDDFDETSTMLTSASLQKSELNQSNSYHKAEKLSPVPQELLDLLQIFLD